MSTLELFIIAVGLSMDAFAVAVCKGLSMKKASLKKAGIVGLYFGIFQAGMPLIGYLLGVQFQNYITSFDHWVAFILLGFIGANMIKESRNTSCEVVNYPASGKHKKDVPGKGQKAEKDASLCFKNMSVLAVATSIDALAIGVTFAFLKVDIVPAVTFIGTVTFILSMVGVSLGNIFGVKYKAKAEFVGGLILVLMGIKILLEHLEIIHF